jgi:hypothetical protein
MHMLTGAALFSGLVVLAVGALAALGRRRIYRPVPAPAQVRTVTGMPDRPWCVYFINYAAGGLAYIGKAADPVARQKRQEADQAKLPDGHRRKWWGLIDPQVRETYMPNQVMWYPTRAAAEAAERAWIRQLNPPENVIKYKTEAA